MPPEASAVGTSPDRLEAILRRTRREVERRRRFGSLQERLLAELPAPEDREAAVDALRRPPQAPPRVIAEVKFRSPSAGMIRERRRGEALRIAQAYRSGGASAVSVLADGPGFGGSALDVRRVAASSPLPVLFKGFVIDPLQVQLARLVGATFVLLLVRALSDVALARLMGEVRELGMEPLVEAADPEELARALAAGARVVGVNARDLRSFRVDLEAAARQVQAIPADRVAILMSGVRGPEDFARAARSRADALLIGEGLMRAEHPAERLRTLLEGR